MEVRGTRGYFGMLAVDPSRQSSGVGRRLVELAEQYARDHGCSVMDIRVVNLRTELQPFYRKLGYVERAQSRWTTRARSSRFTSS